MTLRQEACNLGTRTFKLYQVFELEDGRIGHHLPIPTIAMGSVEPSEYPDDFDEAPSLSMIA